MIQLRGLRKLIQQYLFINKLVQLEGPDRNPLRVHIRSISASNSNSSHNYRCVVAGPQSDIDRDVTDFSNILFLLLAIVATGFLSALVFLLRIILAPLHAAQIEISKIRGGHINHLEVSYPKEITPLAEEINALLKDNQTILSRARLQASNLAHKKPSDHHT
ncbi:MAG: hypothetical protein ACI9FD_001682 [Gammaproteobacteria bacterium]|jgi:hypothetical protein